MGAEMRHCFNPLNEQSPFSFHSWIPQPLLVSSVRGAVICEKCFMNLQKLEEAHKTTDVCEKDVGLGRSCTAFIFSSSIEIPFIDTLRPRNSTWSFMNSHFHY